MNNLLDIENASDARSIAQTNFQRIDSSLAFGMSPSLALDGNPITVLGPPGAGVFILGQFWVDAALAIWRCTAPGTPGTWLQQTPAVVTADPAGAPVNYWTVRADEHFAQFYFDGADWQPV